MPRRGPRSRRAGAYACTPARSRASATPVAAGSGVRAFAGTRAGYAYGTDLSEDGVAEVARAAREAAEVADEDEFEGLPDELGSSDVDGLASPELADWSTERIVELALDGGARGAGARGRDPGRERRLLGRGRLGCARQLARVRGVLPGHAGVGLRLRVRGRGRRPDDRAWGGHGPLPRRARPRGDRRRGRRAGARARGRAPAGEPPLPGRAGRVRGRVVHRLHRLDALRRRRAARPLAVRRPRGRGGGGPRAAPRRRRHRSRRAGQRALRRRGREHTADRPDRGRTPARLPLRLAHRAQGGTLDHRQRQPRLVPLAAVGGHHQPRDRAGRRGPGRAGARSRARGST